MGKSHVELAQLAFEAYAEHAGWLTHDDRTIPGWSEVGEEVQGHWIAVSEALLDEVYGAGQIDYGNPPPRRATVIDNSEYVAERRESR